MAYQIYLLTHFLTYLLSIFKLNFTYSIYKVTFLLEVRAEQMKS